MGKTKGRFTLPGEAGYEAYTMELAEKWGADVIRDSDGTELSEEIRSADYDIYSTICIIRDHNEWARQNRQALQQTFLKSESVIATGDKLEIMLLQGYSTEQFAINSSEKALKYWQVYDRTTDEELPAAYWEYDESRQLVHINHTKAWHSYSVSFLVYRIWEEISMYNHITNSWDKEHLMQIDPIYPETQEYLLQWMETWCGQHPDTDVVRFTSLFYNFVWIWGDDKRHKNCFTDWGSYDFTVSDRSLEEFEKQFGYRMTAEDFINQGKLHCSHRPVQERKKDWMTFINSFVISFGRQLIDIVHRHGKKAYVFYDDSWVGIEPYNGRFSEFDFDGLIKCVFSGFEVRLCANVPVKTHEIRLHPYLFPTGLGGLPTFDEGGNPTKDAREYWMHVRRALLRQPVDRIGLGGYLHLTEKFPDFVDYIEKLADEFRDIVALHSVEAPMEEDIHVAVLHSWGLMRSWTLSGHFHETDQMDLIHVNEALSGLPVKVSFINFNDVIKGNIDQYQVIINAGTEGSAWSGGDLWQDERLVERLTEWVWDGGTFIGINEPSAVEGYEYRIRMAPVLGVDLDFGERICHGRWTNDVVNSRLPILGTEFSGKKEVYTINGKVDVLQKNKDGDIAMTRNIFGKGQGFYLSDFKTNVHNNYLLYSILTDGFNIRCRSSNENIECAFFEKQKKMIAVNNVDRQQSSTITIDGLEIEVTISGLDSKFIDVVI